MTAAYELGKVGYDCRLLEARARPGGRVFTVRRGTVSEEEGQPDERVRRRPLFQRRTDADLAPSPHDAGCTAASCRCRWKCSWRTRESAYLYQTRSSTLTGQRIRLREARADFDGHIAELLSKALSQAQLDQPLTNDDRDRHFAGDYMTDMSSWMQGAFESAREVALAIHARALARR